MAVTAPTNCQHYAIVDRRPVCKAGVFDEPTPGICAGVCQRREAIDETRGPLFGPPVQLRVKAKPVVRAVPRDQWPKWAEWIAGHRAEGDVGVGSTVDRLLGAGGRAFKATFAAFGVDCGCSSRRRAWDGKYPY